MATDSNLTRIYPSDSNLTRTYPVTPEQLDGFRTQLASEKIAAPSGNSGTIETHGVTMSFQYDGTASLTLTIISKPFYVPVNMVWSQLEAYLK